MANRLPMVTLTDAAADRVRAVLARRDPPAKALRIGVKKGGCSGLTYAVDYADEVRPHEEVIEDKGVTVIIDPAATLFLIGSEIDYVESKFESGFVFRNPNEKGRCGCGESFHT